MNLETEAAGSAEAGLALVNPGARSGARGFAAVVRALVPLGYRVLPLPEPGALARLVRAAVDAGVGRVVVAGGDGTVSCAANVLVGTETALGVLPLGTGNDFARSLGLPLRLRAAARVLATGQISTVDVGRANGRCFLNAVSLGLTGKVSRRLNPTLKRRFGALAYLVAAAKLKQSRPRAFKVDLRTEDEQFQLEALQVVVGNGRYQGGGRLISPDATLDDARLDVYALLSSRAEPERSLWRKLRRFAAKLYLGKHTEDPGVLHLRVRKVSLTCEPAHELWCDGEPFGQTPLEAEVLQRALRVIAPRQLPADMD